MTSHEHTSEDGHYLCPTCQQHIPHARIDVVDVAAAVAADKLTEADVFRRTYLGHGTQSSVFVFQGHPGPFRTHVHTTHDEIGYVLEGTGEVRVGGVTRPVKKGDVWVIPANTPHGGQVRGRTAGAVHLVAHRRSRTTRTGSGSTRRTRPMGDPGLLPVIQVPKGSVTPYVLTVGDPDRAAAVGALLDGAARSAGSASTSPGRAPGRASTSRSPRTAWAGRGPRSRSRSSSSAAPGPSSASARAGRSCAGSAPATCSSRPAPSARTGCPSSCCR